MLCCCNVMHKSFVMLEGMSGEGSLSDLMPLTRAYQNLTVGQRTLHTRQSGQLSFL